MRKNSKNSDARTTKPADNSGNTANKQVRGRPFAKKDQATGKNDPRINLAGAPKRGQSWQESIKRITDMTRAELVDLVGEKTKLGKMLKELPENLPLKDALILMSVIQFGRDPDPRMLVALMNREEGMPKQAVTFDGAVSVDGIQQALDKAYANSNPTNDTGTK